MAFPALAALIPMLAGGGAAAGGAAAAGGGAAAAGGAGAAGAGGMGAMGSMLPMMGGMMGGGGQGGGMMEGAKKKLGGMDIIGNIIGGAAKLPRPNRAPLPGSGQPGVTYQPAAQVEAARAGGERGPLSNLDIGAFRTKMPGRGPAPEAQGDPLDAYATQELERRQRMTNIG